MWTEEKNYLLYNVEKITNRPVAGFDLDDTLIKPKSGGKFAVNASDWMFITDEVPDILSKLFFDGYQIIIFTNQKGIGKDKSKIEEWKTKVEDILSNFKFHIIVMASLMDDLFRKPRPVFWVKYIPIVPIEKSFYCGDAAGLKARTVAGVRIPKDHSDSDLKFAVNVGLYYDTNLNFIHRDVMFYGVDENTKLPPGINYSNYNIEYPVDLNSVVVGDYDKFKPYKGLEVIINVGYPASGKTTYTRNYILPYDYVHINQDQLKTVVKCKKLLEESLQNNKSCVINNTSMTFADRKAYIDIAKRFRVRIRCLHFTADIDLCIHNNIYRNIQSDNKVAIIPNVVYYTMRKKYSEPLVSEGFEQINKIDFRVNNPDKYYFMYLM